MINECNFEDKFNVNVKRNVDTGEVEKITKVSKDDVAFLRDLKPHGKQREKSRSAGKRDKRKEKKADKLKAKLERNVDEFARFKDEVKFGETVHEPPQLTVLPRKSSRIDEGRVSVMSTTKRLL